MTPSAGSGQPGSVATASDDSEGEGSGDGSSLGAAGRTGKTAAPATPTTVLSNSPSVDAPSPGMRTCYSEMRQVYLASRARPFIPYRNVCGNAGLYSISTAHVLKPSRRCLLVSGGCCVVACLQSDPITCGLP